MPIQVQNLTPLIQVFDMPTSIHFYRDLLGFEVVQSTIPDIDNSDWVMLRLDEATLMLNTAYELPARPSKPDHARIAAHADTVLFFSCSDVDGAYKELLAMGLNVDEPVTRVYGMRQLTVTDPDGYLLCFQCPAQ